MQDYFNLALLDEFHRQTGVRVDYQTYDDADEVEARLRSAPGLVDVVIIDSFNLNKLRKLSLLHPLDKAAVPNFQHASDRFINLDADPGNQFSVPYHWGTTLVAYRTDLVPNPEHSWRLLWDPALKGKVMMMQDSFEPLAVALLLGGKSPATRNNEDYEAASKMLLDQIDSMGARYGSYDDVKTALQEGTIAAAMCYNGDAATVAEEEPKVDFFIPKEGATMWVDCLAIARDSKDPAMAHAFLDFFMDPRVAAENANSIQFASTNEAADAHIDPELRNDPRLYPPPEIEERLHLVPELDAERDALLNKFWFTVRGKSTARADNNKVSVHETEVSP
jgi:spermidine/putrescine-binding protein